MNPFRLAESTPRRPWLRLGLGLLGTALVVWVAWKVDWRQFEAVLRALRWGWVLASFALGALAVGARALRMAWIFGGAGRIGPAWRAIALGYLGKALLPMGAGELIKMGALQEMLGVPPATAAAGTFLDRLFDLLGVFLLVAALAGAGVSMHLRTGPLAAGAIALALLGLGFLLALRLRGRPGFLGRTVGHIADVLGPLRRPAHLGRLLAAQALVTALDLAAIYTGLLAFSFGPALPLLVSVILSVYLMLGSALPLLPSGAGTLQVACALALQPAGVSAAGAFAYSLVSQGTGLVFACAIGAAAALWPSPSRPS